MKSKRRDFLKLILVGIGGLVLGKIFSPMARATVPNPGHSISHIEPSAANNETTGDEHLTTVGGVMAWGPARYS